MSWRSGEDENWVWRDGDWHWRERRPHEESQAVHGDGGWRWRESQAVDTDSGEEEEDPAPAPKGKAKAKATAKGKAKASASQKKKKKGRPPAQDRRELQRWRDDKAELERVRHELQLSQDREQVLQGEAWAAEIDMKLAQQAHREAETELRQTKIRLKECSAAYAREVEKVAKTEKDCRDKTEKMEKEHKIEKQKLLMAAAATKTKFESDQSMAERRHLAELSAVEQKVSDMTEERKALKQDFEQHKAGKNHESKKMETH